MGVLASNGADVDVETSGHGSNILADVAHGNVSIVSHGGDNSIYVKGRS